MDITAIKQAFPESAKDLRLNFDRVLQAEHLTARQTAGTFLACAFAARNAELLATARTATAEVLGADAAEVEKVAATMGMNNIYYRSIHLLENAALAQMPAKLRMQSLAHPGGDRLDRELWAFAVSAVNGCGKCLKAHEHTLKQEGARDEALQDSLRIAAVVAASAAALDAASLAKSA
ncbi:MAG: carboxymuconolactone decarboxylase family protein [Planctomycetota bacterium]|jgi:alkyl hydroperoxide reductase subunit D